MAECGGDGLIKLFGTTITVPDTGDGAAAKDLQHSGGSSSSTIEYDVQENAHRVTSDTKSSPEQQQPQPGGAAGRREKLRKPDKVLPCPRCSSMDTKFCYFNNYNVNQPRHFCKNCQRYWTAGGAMRNVPVGAGRRKNKAAAAASHFLHRVRAALPAGDALRATGGTVLSFGHGVAPHAVDLAEQKASTPKEKLLLPTVNAGDPPVDSSSNRDGENQGGAKEKVTVEKPANGVQQHPASSLNGATMWPYMCAAPSQACRSSGFAIPMYPAPPGYWGCMVPGAWSLPWPMPSPTLGVSSPASTAPSVSSGAAASLTLGKHPREEDVRSRSQGKVWVPKTIRIDNTDEVARSSILSMAGINGEKQDANARTRKLGMVFEWEREAKTAKQAMITSSPLLQENHGARTRSLNFQERS